MSSDRAPLSKQIAGAVVGGALALMIYAGFTTLESPQSENLSGLLVTPQARLGLNEEGDHRIASKDIDEEEARRIASKTRQIANQFGASALEAIEEAEVVLPEELEAQELVGDIEEAWEEMEEQEWEDSDLEYSDEEPDFYGDTDELPDSGIGVWLASLIALFGATYFLYRRKLADGA